MGWRTEGKSFLICRKVVDNVVRYREAPAGEILGEKVGLAYV